MTLSKSLLIVFATLPMAPFCAIAGPPDIQTPSPVIYLADNLDEADGLGWCIDTVGRGLSDRLHAHSCKPRGGDVQFRFDQATGHIASVAFAGKCMARHDPADANKPLQLINCDDSPQQRFVFRADLKSFHPALEQDLCLTAGANSRKAGPFMSRDLGFAKCAQSSARLQTWIIKR